MRNPESSVRKSAVMHGLTPAQVYAVVVDFPCYPRLFQELKEARVLSRRTVEESASARETVRAEFKGNIVLPFRYVLDLDCDSRSHTVDWRYVEGEMVKNSEGGWRFVAEGDGTRVDYEVALEIAAPVPGFLLRKITDGLVSLSLPAMFASVEREARARAGR